MSLGRALRRHARRYDRFHVAVFLTIVVAAYVAVPQMVKFVDAVRGYDPAFYEPKDFERQAWIKRQVAPTIDPLAHVVPPEIAPDAWRQAVDETRAMLVTLTASNLLDLAQMHALRAEVQAFEVRS